VIDFPDTVPGAQLRPLTVNRGEVKSVRVGLFSANPPVTRIVLDLSGPRSYELFPAGNTLIVKLRAAKAIEDGANILAVASPGAIVTPLTAPRPAPVKAVQASFRKGLLSIRAQKATLAEVLYEVHRQTGAEIAVPAGAEQEQVTTDIGPMLPKDALAALLNGTHYNFILVSADNDPRSLGRVVLMPKADGPMTGQAMGQQDFSPAPQQPVDMVNEATPPPDGPAAEPNHQRVVSPVPIPPPPEQAPPADEQPN
jgi:hypothetical protein